MTPLLKAGLTLVLCLAVTAAPWLPTISVPSRTSPRSGVPWIWDPVR